jgi:hypothetical protein
MWLPISLGMKLNQPLAVMLDRIFVDIVFYRIHKGAGNSCDTSSFVDVFRNVGLAFERFSGLPELAIVSQSFRHEPLCFAPILYAPSALYDAADRSAGFAYQIGKLLEERLGLTNEFPATEFDDGAFVARVEQLTAQTGELLRSGDLSMMVLTHRMLLRAQTLCVLLASFRQLRALAGLGLSTATPVLTEPPLR